MEQPKYWRLLGDADVHVQNDRVYKWACANNSHTDVIEYLKKYQ
jgi:hypothetical protein